MNMTAEEKNIWNAAFAAAIITDYRIEFKSELDAGPKEGSDPYKNAANWTSGTEAIELANLAVEKFREVMT